MTAEPRNEQVPRRRYRQEARARSAEATRRRILAATEALLRENAPSAVPIAAAARAAGTTVPTILRHFATKDALVSAALTAAITRVRAERPRVSPGDHLGAARVLAGEYERHAPLLRAVEAAPQGARRDVEAAHRLHRDWLARTFAPGLSPLAPVVHRRRLAQLVTVSGPGTWRALREAEHLGIAQAQAALAELLRTVSR
jgi:AcrR family transcriptional regulator